MVGKMSAAFGAKTLVPLATVVVAALVVIALVLASPSLSSQGPTSSPSGSATSDGSATTTGSTSAKSASLTINSTTYIAIPFGVGSIESLNFQPSGITVVVGVNNTIVWNDLDAEQHTVTSLSVPAGAAKFDSGILNQGQTFTVTLTVPGTYRFYCTIHPTWMRGTIVVKA